MKLKGFKGVISIETSVIGAIAIYIIFFIINVGIYFYDINALNANMVIGMLRIQNHIECRSDLNSRSIDKIVDKLSRKELGIALKSYVDKGMMLSEVKTVKVDTGFIDLYGYIEIEHKGLVIPFKNIVIKKEIRLADINPSGSLRINRYVNDFVKGD